MPIDLNDPKYFDQEESSLTVTNYRLNNEDVQESLIPFLQQYPYIKIINLSGSLNQEYNGADMLLEHVEDSIKAALITEMSKLKNLAHLDLSRNGIEGKSVEALASLIGKLTQLIHLELGDNNMGEQEVKMLAPQIGKLNHLKYLGTRGNSGQLIAIKKALSLMPIDLNDPRYFDPKELSLTVTNYRLNNEDVQESLIPFLQQHPDIKIINLSGSLNMEYGGAHMPLEYVEDSIKAGLITEISNLSNLTHLDLSRNYMQEKSVAALAFLFGKSTQLIHLEFGDNRMGEQEVKILAPEIGKLNHLKYLGMRGDISRGNRLGEKGAAVLLPEIVKLKQLVSLNLNDNDIGEENIIFFAPQLGELKQLKYLGLNRNNIGEKGAIALASPIGGLKQLEHLDSGGNEIEGEGNDMGEEGAVVFLPQVGSLNKLTQLNLADNQIGEKGADALIHQIKNLQGFIYLISLDLGGNYIGDEGMKVLIPQICTLTCLGYLSLYNNWIEQGGAEALASHIDKLRWNLKHLILHSNDMWDEDEVTEKLATSICELRQLESLDLNYSAIKDKVVKVLATKLEQLSKLKRFDLSANQIRNKGACELAPKLAQLPELEDFSLEGNQIGEEGVTVLHCALAAHRNLRASIIIQEDEPDNDIDNNVDNNPDDGSDNDVDNNPDDDSGNNPDNNSDETEREAATQAFYEDLRIRRFEISKETDPIKNINYVKKFYPKAPPPTLKYLTLFAIHKAVSSYQEMKENITWLPGELREELETVNKQTRIIR